jgi:hypothetical protein
VAARDVGGGDGGVVHVRGGHHGADGDPQHGIQHVSVMSTPSAESMNDSHQTQFTSRERSARP